MTADDDGRAVEVEGSVADEDRAQAQSRTALRRVTRARQRRRWAVEGVAVLVCLVVLISYLASRSDSKPGDDRAGGSGDVPAGAARPTGHPATDGRTGEAGPAMPGLRPRQRPPSPDPTPSASAPVASPTAPASPRPPVLSVTRGEMPAEVDLTAVGTRDWMHWGERGGRSTVRKRSGSGEIVDGGGAGIRVG